MTGEFHVNGASRPAALTSLHHYASAPASPSTVFVPFDWESKPGTPKLHHTKFRSIPNNRFDDEQEEYVDYDGMEFAFQFRGQVVSGGGNAATADELFESGKIRTLKLPPRLQQASSNLGNDGDNCLFASPKTATTTARSRKSPVTCLLRRGRKEVEEFDPFGKAMEETTRSRERERWLRGSVRGSRRPTTRSASPLRSGLLPDCAEAPTTNPSSGNTPKGSGGGSGRKWRMKYFLIFWSATEGRGSKDLMGKYGEVSANVSAQHTTKRTSSALLDRVGDVRGLVKGLRSFVRGRS